MGSVEWIGGANVRIGVSAETVPEVVSGEGPLSAKAPEVEWSSLPQMTRGTGADTRLRTGVPLPSSGRETILLFKQGDTSRRGLLCCRANATQRAGRRITDERVSIIQGPDQGWNGLLCVGAEFRQQQGRSDTRMGAALRRHVV